MKCPNCGNHKFERLDYAIVRCTECYSLFDPYVYPDFPEPKVEVGQIRDTSPASIPNLLDELDTLEEDSDEWDEEDDEEIDDYEEWEDEDYEDDDYDEIED